MTEHIKYEDRRQIESFPDREATSDHSAVEEACKADKQEEVTAPAFIEQSPPFTGMIYRNPRYEAYCASTDDTLSSIRRAEESARARFDSIITRMNAYLMFLANKHDTSWALPLHRLVLPSAVTDVKRHDGIRLTESGDAKWTIHFDWTSHTTYINLRGVSFTIQHLIERHVLCDYVITKICDDLERHFGPMLQSFIEAVNDVVLKLLDDRKPSEVT